jgi:hypothetical protein
MTARNPESIANQQAPGFAEKLLEAARRGGTEADFRREVSRLLEEIGSASGLTIVPRDEFSVARGRVDSLYNRLVLEYKRPGILKVDNEGRTNQDVIQQVKNYILDVAKREKRETHRLAGVATDGFYFIFVRRVGEGWAVDEPAPVNAATAVKFLRLLFSLSFGVAMVPENLVEDFGPRTLRAQRAVRALYTSLHANKHPLVLKLFEQWRLFFSEATDYKEWATRIEGKEEFRTFVKGMGLDPKYAEAPKVFFALHTYYALLIKLVASLAAGKFAGGTSSPLGEFANKTGDDLKASFVNLEQGGLFKEYGIRNFLEGDFFGWYLTAWDHDIEEAAGRLVQRLAEYDPGTLELAPENARDLLKKLYHYLLPREIRHDLGEYYTPDWLAERLIIQTMGPDLGDPSKRVLDPSCGSGTFLVLLIKHIRAQLSKRRIGPERALELILQNIVGFDLNPLAVIASRTNYLLALGDLLKSRQGDIDIPVYQADSVMTPSRGTDLWDGHVYPLKTSVGEFRVPSAFAHRERMDALANELDGAVDTGVGEEAFLHRLQKAVDMLDKDFVAASAELKTLYKRLRRLHEEGLNGVWARIIKNAFAPLFIEPCDYVVGNPPWVNWESLPDEYRLQSKPLWERYGLFPHGGMDTILGKGKKDIAMLMTYVAVDRYLNRNGKIGFVLPQNLFKTSGAGQGFRRFLLPDGTPFGPLVVEDMVELQPFEGATNRTAVAVFVKGRPVRYPVSYQYWKKRASGRGSAIGFDTPYEEVTAEKVTFRSWFGEPVDRENTTSPWMTARRKALKALHNVLGQSQYEAHEGSNTGGANGVYWVEIVGKRPGGLSIVANITEGAKRKAPSTQAAVETELLYPLLRGRDVARWNAAPSAHIIMAQDPATRRGVATDVMEKEYPKVHSYLSRFEKLLRSRAALKRYFKDDDPYWSMFNVSPFTFAPWKVVWREVGHEVDAAVIGKSFVGVDKKPVVPDHTCILAECETSDEAHYLCAMLNSSPARLAIRNYIVLHPDPHVLKNINIQKYSEKDKRHARLSELSKSAHKAAQKGHADEVGKIEHEIDHLAAKLWGLSDDELAEIMQSLEEA